MARRNQGPRLRWHRYGAAWYICWTENGSSRERSTGTTSREEAEIVFAEWLQIRGQKSGPSDPTQTLVTDVLADYARERGPRVAAPRVIGCAIDALTRFWQGRTVADVTPQTCWLYGEKRGRSANTVRRELNVLRTAINYAHKHGKLTRSVPVELPPAPPSKQRWLTRNEAARLIRASRKDRKARLYMPLFILIGLYTGRRKEAILSLRWPQVDLNAKLINFEIEGRQRTKKRRGKVPIPDRLLPHLVRARLRGSDLGPVLHINGKPIANIKKGFEAACRRAGIEGVTPHCLRHTTASWLMMGGTPVIEIAKYLVMTEKMLVDTYGHHSPDWLRGAANAIGKPFRRISA